MRFRFFALAALLAANGPALVPGFTPTPVQAQQKLPLTLEDIWAKPTFRSASVPGFNWMNDGRYYSALESGSLVQHEVTTGKALATLVAAADLQLPGAAKPLDVDGYTFNSNEQKILFTTGTSDRVIEIFSNDLSRIVFIEMLIIYFSPPPQSSR